MVLGCVFSRFYFVLVLCNKLACSCMFSALCLWGEEKGVGGPLSDACVGERHLAGVDAWSLSLSRS